MTRAGIVVVTHNSADVIGACLDSCTVSSLPIVVIDNASHDNTIEQVRLRPAVQLIANTTNRGFASAANQGVAALGADFTLLLNPDVTLQTTVYPLVEACSRNAIGIATGMLLDGSGAPQTGFHIRRFPTPATLICEVLGLNRIFRWNPANRRYRCLDLDHAEVAEVEQPAGAFLMFRRQLWERLGGFDTQFHPLWFEDVDFCKRAREIGFRSQYVPEVVACHRGGHSVSQLTWRCREVYWYASLLRYASKHFGPYALRWVSAAVVLGSALRAIARVVQCRSLRPISVYAKIARQAILCMVSGRVREPSLKEENTAHLHAL